MTGHFQYIEITSSKSGRTKKKNKIKENNKNKMKE